MISSTMDHVMLLKGKINFIYFDDIAKEFELREEISNWCNSKEDSNDLFFLLDELKELTFKNCNQIELIGGSLGGFSKKIFLPWIKYQILNTPEFYEQLQKVQKELEKFLYGLELKLSDLEVELYLNEFPLDQLLKSMHVEVSANGEYSKGYIFNRTNTISLWNQMIFNENPKIIFYYFPESDGITSDTIHFLKYLEEQRITTIAITRSVEIMRNFEINQINLIKRNGTIYPISELYLQLKAFSLYKNDSTTIELALKDFHEDYDLLNEKYKEFLLSGKFNL